MQILSANIGVQIKPVFHFQTRANVPKNRPLTKPGSDCGSVSGSDQISDRIGSDSGSDRNRLVSAELLFLRKSCFNNDTGRSDSFFRAACVSNKKNCFSCITSLKIHHQPESHRKELFSSKLHGEIFCCINS